MSDGGIHANDQIQVRHGAGGIGEIAYIIGDINNPQLLHLDPVVLGQFDLQANKTTLYRVDQGCEFG